MVSNVLVLINSDKIQICPCNLQRSKKVVGHAHALPDLRKRHFSSEQDIANYSKCTLQKHKPLIQRQDIRGKIRTGYDCLPINPTALYFHAEYYWPSLQEKVE